MAEVAVLGCVGRGYIVEKEEEEGVEFLIGCEDEFSATQDCWFGWGVEGVLPSRSVVSFGGVGDHGMGGQDSSQGFL